MLYTTRSGRFHFVVKPAEGIFSSSEGNPAVAAYLIDRKLKLGFTPQTEEVILEGIRYSVQKYVPSRLLVPELGPDPFPGELILFDALCGNFDRRPNGHNYLRSVRSNHRRTAAGYIAIDQQVTPVSLEAWLRTRKDVVDFKKIVQKNPKFINDLRQWRESEIQNELGEYLPPKYLDGLLTRRREILLIFDSKR